MPKGVHKAVGANHAIGLFPHVTNKGTLVPLGLKPDQIVGAHFPHEGLVIWKREKQFLRRPRDMEEESDSVATASPAQIAAKRDKMIVLHPNDIVLAQQ